jgi:hypothetical protein
MIERRFPVYQAWAAFLDGADEVDEVVVPFTARAAS